MKRLLSVLCLSIFAMPAHAAISEMQGEAIVLADYPGEVTDVERKRDFYEYEVEQEDGSLLKIKVGRDSGVIREVEISEFGGRYSGMAKPPIDDDDAKDIAREYIKSQLRRNPRIEIKAANDLLVDDRFVYGINMEVKNVDYQVQVSPYTGRVLAAYKFVD